MALTGPVFADLPDVTAIWRPVTDPTEIALVLGWIGEASQEIRDNVPAVMGLDVDARIADGSLSQATVRSIVARMVRRVMLNPTGVRQQSVSMEDYVQSSTIDSTLSKGELYISDSEMKRLLGFNGSRVAFDLVTFDITPWDQPVYSGALYDSFDEFPP